jgi:murein hydrolase activator
MQILAADLAARQKERETIGNDVERSDRDIADLARAGRELGLMLAEQRQVKEGLETRLSAGRASLERERQGLAELVRAAYTTGRSGALRVLLDRDGVHRLDRAMAYYGHLNRERQRRIAEVAEQTRSLERLAREATEESERLGRIVVFQEDTRRRLVAARAERAALLAELDRGIASGREGIAALEADAQALRQVIGQLARQAQIMAEVDLQQVSLAQRRGRLPWPLGDVTVLAPFNGPKGGAGQLWDGVVLAADEGTEVRAVHHGRVVYADWLRGFGLLAVIDHGDGYMSLYGYNQTLLKDVGEWVGAGDVIALTGRSGGQDAGQLYFAIRHRGQPQDPAVWCSATDGAG